MPDYNENQIAGTAWQRAGYIAINNPRPSDGVPSVTFMEEQVIPLGNGQEHVRKLGGLVETFSPESYGETFDLLHPETGEVIGQASYLDVYVMMASAYRHVAGKRDQAAESPLEPEPEA